jgi:hypothetical protein
MDLLGFPRPATRVAETVAGRWGLPDERVTLVPRSGQVGIGD